MTRYFAKLESRSNVARLHFHPKYVNGLRRNVSYPAIQVYAVAKSAPLRHWCVVGWVSLAKWSDNSRATYLFSNEARNIVVPVTPAVVEWTRVALDHWLETGEALDEVTP